MYEVRMTGRQLAKGALLAMLGLATPCFAADEPNMDVQAEIKALKAEVARLRAKDDESWLTERRAEEVKALIKDVLSDADTRASLAEGGLTAGYNKHYYLSSEDGSFLMEFEGQLQTRWIYDHRENPGKTTVNSVVAAGTPPVPTVVTTTTQNDADQSGFQFRRAKFKVGGHIFNDFGYKLVLAAERADGAEVLEEGWVSYKLADNLTVLAGRFKAPFQRENLISSSKQMAVERSSVQEIFRLDWTQGVMFDYKTDMLRFRGSLDQGRMQFSDFTADGTDIGATLRGDVLLAGDWGQTEDFAAWSKDPQSLSIGAAVHYEAAETGTSAANSDFVGWTVDGMYKNTGLTLFVAGYGRHTESGTTPSTTTDDYGLEAMVGYMIVPDTIEPFVRYGRIMMDKSRVAGTLNDQDVNEYTVGFNWYQHKHAAKFTLDFTYFDAPLNTAFLSPGFSSGQGLQRDAAGEDGQYTVRAQYQLLF
ncbi:MAG: hypothetical protein GC162_07705 [Planctomycetes bacterium]|nr:hypothetical protein [Planctomycetota bacterium]